MINIVGGIAVEGIQMVHKTVGCHGLAQAVQGAGGWCVTLRRYVVIGRCDLGRQGIRQQQAAIRLARRHGVIIEMAQAGAGLGAHLGKGGDIGHAGSTRLDIRNLWWYPIEDEYGGEQTGIRRVAGKGDPICGRRGLVGNGRNSCGVVARGPGGSALWRQ